MTTYQDESQCLHTVLDYIRFGMSEFVRNEVYFGHGMDNGWDEALALVLHVLNCDYEIGPKILNARLTSFEKEAVLTLFERRVKERVPVPYLTNKAYFCGLEFYVNQETLIPRSPIAELIESEFVPWAKSTDAVESVLELCTGSACIAIALAHAFPNAKVLASDISDGALEVAKRNVGAHQLEGQVELVHSDVFNEIEKQTFDFIIANPPYVGAIEMETLPKEYLHEPRMALEARDNGLEIVERILQEAKHYLKKGGFIVVEVGNSEHELQEKYPQVPFLWLEFEHGGQGVFLLTLEQLQEFF